MQKSIWKRKSFGLSSELSVKWKLNTLFCDLIFYAQLNKFDRLKSTFFEFCFLRMKAAFKCNQSHCLWTSFLFIWVSFEGFQKFWTWISSKGIFSFVFNRLAGVFHQERNKFSATLLFPNWKDRHIKYNETHEHSLNCKKPWKCLAKLN